MKETLFTVKGGFDISKKLKPMKGAAGDIIGYTLPDGRIVRLVVALEIENTKSKMVSEAFDYITSSAAMELIGFNNLDYSELTFYPQ